MIKLWDNPYQTKKIPIDDTDLCVLTEQSMIGILYFFKQYNLATGTTINISKTTITPLANAKTYNIDKKNAKCQNK